MQVCCLEWVAADDPRYAACILHETRKTGWGYLGLTCPKACLPERCTENNAGYWFNDFRVYVACWELAQMTKKK